MVVVYLEALCYLTRGLCHDVGVLMMASTYPDDTLSASSRHELKNCLRNIFKKGSHAIC